MRSSGSLSIRFLALVPQSLGFVLAVSFNVLTRNKAAHPVRHHIFSLSLDRTDLAGRCPSVKKIGRKLLLEIFSELDEILRRFFIGQIRTVARRAGPDEAQKAPHGYQPRPRAHPRPGVTPAPRAPPRSPPMPIKSSPTQKPYPPKDFLKYDTELRRHR